MTPEELHSAACDMAEKYGHTPRDPKKYNDVTVICLVNLRKTTYTVTIWGGKNSIESSMNETPEKALRTFELKLKEHQIRNS